MTENPRAMAKLFKEAERVKQVLSANADHFAQVNLQNRFDNYVNFGKSFGINYVNLPP